MALVLNAIKIARARRNKRVKTLVNTLKSTAASTGVERVTRKIIRRDKVVTPFLDENRRRIYMTKNGTTFVKAKTGKKKYKPTPVFFVTNANRVLRIANATRQ